MIFLESSFELSHFSQLSPVFSSCFPFLLLGGESGGDEQSARSYWPFPLGCSYETASRINLGFFLEAASISGCGKWGLLLEVG
jgi:hypothetical protein